MSTRLRVTLLYGGQVHATGRIAVKELCYRAYPNKSPAFHRIALRHGDNKGLSKRDRLLKMAERLPKGFTLVLTQEPRRTRKNRSAYWRNRQGQVLDQAEVQQQQAIPEPNNVMANGVQYELLQQAFAVDPFRRP
jgi:hypothetical protein